MDYGTGAIYGCPADQWDLDLQKYNLDVIPVICPQEEKKKLSKLRMSLIEDGLLINSNFNGLNVERAKEEIINKIETENIGSKRLILDYVIGVFLDRYWGCPIPVIYLENGEIELVPDSELP